MRTWMLTWGLVLGAMGTWAQQVPCALTFRGQVLDSMSGDPLEKVWIRVPTTDGLYWSDERGYFEIGDLCSLDSLILQVFLAGYRPKLVGPIGASKGERLLIRLQRWGEELGEVSVHAHHRPNLFESGEKMGKKEIEAGFGLTLARLTEALAGWRTSDHGMTVSKPMIHGLSGARMQIVSDEMGLEDQSWGAEHAPMLDPQQAGRIQVVEGAQGLRYGSAALGRVLQLLPPPMSQHPGSKWVMQSMGMTNGRALGGSLIWDHGSGRIPGLAWRLQAKAQKGGNYRIPGYYVANSGYTETSLSGRVSWRRTWGHIEGYWTHLQHKLGMYEGSHTGSTADLILAINSPVPRVQDGFRYEIGRPQQTVGQSRTGLHIHWDIPVGSLDFRYGFQSNLREEFEPLRGSGDQAQLHLNLQTHQASLDWEHDLMDKLHGHLGLDLSSSRNRFRDGDRFLIPAYDARKAAIYLTESLEAGGLDWEGGLRVDFQRLEVYQPEGPRQTIHYYEDDYMAPSFSFGLARRWPGWGDTRLIFHSSWRPPHVAERFSRGLHQGAARMEFGNPDLDPERSHSLFLDQHFRWNPGSLRLRVYGQDFQGYIYPEPGEPVLSIRGSFRSYRYEQVPARLYGGDLSLEHHWTPSWQTRLQASWARGRDKLRRDWLMAMPSDQYKLTQSWQLPRTGASPAWVVEASLRHVSEQRRIPIDFDSRDYLRPPGAYTLFSARIDKSFSLNSGEWALSLEVDNLLGTRYRDYLDAFRYYLDSPGRNFILRAQYTMDRRKE